MNLIDVKVLLKRSKHPSKDIRYKTIQKLLKMYVQNRLRISRKNLAKLLFSFKDDNLEVIEALVDLIDRREK